MTPLANYYRSLGTLQSLKHLVSLAKDKIVSKTIFRSVVKSLFDEIELLEREPDYVIYLCTLVGPNNDEKINLLLRNICSSPRPIAELQNFLLLLAEHSKELIVDDCNFLYEAICNRYLDGSEIIDLSAFLEQFEIHNEDITSKINDSLNDVVHDELANRAWEIDISSYVTIFHDDHNFDVDVDRNSVENELTKLAESILDDYYSSANGLASLSISVSTERIAGLIDIDDLVSGYLESKNDDSHHDRAATFGSDLRVDDIDDLFERT